MSHDWGYTVQNGPEKWGEKFPLANGVRQSPVNIITSQTKQSTDLQVNPLRWTYVPENVKCLINPGYCWRVDVNAKGSELTGGPLNNDKYVIEQFHCHWGCSDGRGSEHTVDGQSFSAELHIVHWNSSKYNSFQEAAGHPDGLAVLGVFLKVGSEHEELDQIARLMPYIGHKGDRITLKSVDIAKFLPENKAYWTYEGSLTTPPFNESVTWILFKEPMYVSSEQINLFRDLRRYDVNDECPCNEQNWLVYDSVEEDPGKIVNNFRPPLELGNRELREVGPKKLGEKFPLANGVRQSPVNIITSQTKQSTDLQVNPLRWTYVPENVKCLINPGYCWRVDVNAKGSELTGGPLNNDRYVIEQFHCHWGCSDGRGSEHTVDGQSFSAELHIVHWNSSKYNSFQEAAGHPDGLAVLGVFLKGSVTVRKFCQVGSEHEELDQIARLMPYIGHKGDRITLKSVDIAKFLPENKAYWTYEGSLATPPFNESVTWILFNKPMYVSSEQINLFRNY